MGVGFAVAIAGAQWLVNGTGNGYARAATAQPLTTESASVSGTLYPGGRGALSVQVHNPNPFPVTVTTVSLDGPIASDSAACNTGGHGVSFTGLTGLALVVPAASSARFDVPNAVAMADVSPNACQGATFTIPVSLSGGSGGPTTTTGGGAVSYTFYADADKDGYGDSFNGVTVPEATPPPFYVADNTDCNDHDGGVHPGALELRTDGVDNNCNGVVDE